jgi:hypothetical protein
VQLKEREVPPGPSTDSATSTTAHPGPASPFSPYDRDDLPLIDHNPSVIVSHVTALSHTGLSALGRGSRASQPIEVELLGPLIADATFEELGRVGDKGSGNGYGSGEGEGGMTVDEIIEKNDEKAQNEDTPTKAAEDAKPDSEDINEAVDEISSLPLRGGNGYLSITDDLDPIFDLDISNSTNNKNALTHESPSNTSPGANEPNNQQQERSGPTHSLTAITTSSLQPLSDSERNPPRPLNRPNPLFHPSGYYRYRKWQTAPAWVEALGITGFELRRILDRDFEF